MATATPKRPGYLILVCPDSQLLLEHIENAARAFPPEKGEYERLCYWGDETPPNKFWSNLSLTGLFGIPRLLVVRQANLWKADVWHMLDKALGRLGSATWPVLCFESPWEKGAYKFPAWLGKLSCIAKAEKAGWIWRQGGLTDSTIRSYIQRQAQLRQLRLSPEALATLCDTIPRQAHVVATELDKVALIHAGNSNPVSLEEISTADWSPDANIFACSDMLMQGNAVGVWKEYSRLSDPESTVFMMLGILAMNLRKLWQCLCGDKPALFGRSAQLFPSLARRLGPAGISQAMGIVMESEQSIKSGAADPSQVFERLLSTLLPLFATR